MLPSATHGCPTMPRSCRAPHKISTLNLGSVGISCLRPAASVASRKDLTGNAGADASDATYAPRHSLADTDHCSWFRTLAPTDTVEVGKGLTLSHQAVRGLRATGRSHIFYQMEEGPGPLEVETILFFQNLLSIKFYIPPEVRFSTP